MTPLKQAIHIREMVLFAMLGAIMFCSKIIMEILPNIHLLGMLTMVYTIVFRTKALIPIYVYVILNGLYAGFSMWWMPYLYIWTILWGITMLLPKKMPVKVKFVVYPVICALHGFAFGFLYSPAHALMMGLNLEQTLTWVLSGIYFDAIHGIGNFAIGFLVLPLATFLGKFVQKPNYN